MNLFRRALWWFGFLALLAGPLMAAEYTGKVVSISDGDTLTLLVPDDELPAGHGLFQFPFVGDAQPVPEYLPHSRRPRAPQHSAHPALHRRPFGAV
jgi:hypothetical protein